MQAIRQSIPDVVLIEPKVFGDSRGFFYESFNQQAFQAATGVQCDFVQDNHSRSSQGVLRGLHYQLSPRAQGKLVRVVRGKVFDVAVDIRKDSPAYGQWFGLELSEENQRMLWVPPGLAHGFVVLSDIADFEYKCTDYYNPQAEGCLIWNDPAVGIEWPISNPLLSAKDQLGKTLKELNS